MAQLKSFKYIEIDEEARNEEKLSKSSISLSSWTGGNIVSETSLITDQPILLLNAGGSPSNSETSVSLNVSHSVSREIVEGDGDEKEQKDPLQNLEVKTDEFLDNKPKSIARSRNTTQRSDVVWTPLSVRHQPSQLGDQLAGSPTLLHRRTPSFGHHLTVFPLGDNISQVSFERRQNQQNNHFEIRWRSINLMTKKKQPPKFISENPLYKLFKRANQPAEKIGYSPALKHKSINIISESPELDRSSMSDTQSVAPLGVRPILNNVSGSVFSGQLTAVLGPSGVGKTTLLDSLTGRNNLDGTGKVSLIGGGNSKRLSVVTVPQQDLLPEKLTTIEDLRFTSRLKNPQRCFDHERNIDRVVRHLQMQKFLHTRIKKLSGGEARRLSIGRELLGSPDIMILDEPTSGLDANTCKKIILALRDIVEHKENCLDRPMAIIVTIHQPQKEVYNLFHRIYLMGLGGRAIYEGPPANLMPTIIEHMSIEANSECSARQLDDNPAIVALEVASGEYGINMINELAQHHESQIYEESIFADELGTLTSNSPLSSPNIFKHPRMSPRSASPQLELLRSAKMNSKSSSGRQTPIIKRLNGAQLDRLSNVTSNSYAPTYDSDLPESNSRLKVDKRLRRSVVMKGDFVSQTLTLMERVWIMNIRDVFLMSIRILGYLLVAGGMVQIFAPALDPNEHQCPIYESQVDDIVTFMDTTKNRLTSLQSTLTQASSTHTFFFYFLLCTTMVTAALGGLTFPLQMRMFVREYKNGWYSPGAFIMSNTLAELPVDIIGPLLTLLIVYPLCHQPDSMFYWREIGYIIVVVAASVTCKSQAQIVGAFLMNSVENSVFLACVVVSPPALLSGLAVRVSQMPLPLQWIAYGSFLRYAFESLLLLRYGYDMCPCDRKLVQGYPTNASERAIPHQLERLTKGFLALNSPVTAKNNLNESAITSEGTGSIFVDFIRLVTEAGNMFVTDPAQLGDCESYRSLYLMDTKVKDRILPQWIGAMLLIFVIYRFLTYFVVKTVIKTRRHS